jgi:hypothetical protein
MRAVTEVLHCSRLAPPTMARRCGFRRGDRSTRAIVETKTETAFPVILAFPIGMMPGIRGHTRSNRPFKRGSGNCWSLLVRGEGSDLADQRSGFDSESGPNTTGNGTCRFFSYEVQGMHRGNF